MARKVRTARKRKDRGLDPSDREWLTRIGTRSEAVRIANDHKERPYWLRIKHGPGDGINPLSPFFPCSTFRTAKHFYYGFLLRQHREDTCDLWLDAQRVSTSDVDKLRGSLSL